MGLAMQTPHDFEKLTRQASDAGVRLEVVRGVTTWEALPVYRHQRAVRRIDQSIRPLASDGTNACGCVVVQDLSIRFPDGSHKRPDISVFCREPDELDSEVTLLPEAVIEVLSEEYEAKDLLIGVPFYRQVGIRDIVVLDPRTGDVRHWQQGQPERAYASPVFLTFLCGCAATV